ncbi:MAG: BlaI/MecI/CopY family transcriptional regulator [Acidimicrobiales bacterium]|nr:BlaI/MecI/CopY family transcriptional regulator [Acidimicrobiia bacterium]NNF53030.1 BlaI/MecI/CopY family transcriptional regulator [Acidimicrobiales bacterium]
MAAKRPMGALEEAVMAYLWTTDGPATPAEVHQAVAPELAYTTVMTILARLFEKGRLNRGERGRAYTYEPIRSEAEHRADEMQTTLVDAGDRAAVLSQFVESLDAQDAKTLRKLLSRGI